MEKYSWISSAKNRKNEKVKNVLNKYDGDWSDEEDQEKDYFYNKHTKNVVKKMRKGEMDTIETINTIIKSILDPSFNKQFSFSVGFPTPSLPIYISNSLYVRTNSLGAAWVEVNFGQFLTQSRFVNTDGTATTSVRSSNIFVSKETVAVNVNQVGSGLPITLEAINASNMNMEANAISLYSAVKPGPALVRYDFMGNLNNTQGVLSVGIDYTNVVTSSTYNGSVESSLSPDLSRITSKAIEDCPYSLATNLTNSVEGSYIPQDFNSLKLKPPAIGDNDIQQRFFLFITGAEANAVIGRLSVSQCWEAKPTSSMADLHSTMNVTTSDQSHLHDAITAIYENRSILRVVEGKDFGLGKYTKYV